MSETKDQSLLDKVRNAIRYGMTDDGTIADAENMVAEEREFWEQNIKDDVVRAGLDPAGCVGMAHVHLLVEEIEKLQAERKEWREIAANHIEHLEALVRKAEVRRETNSRGPVE